MMDAAGPDGASVSFGVWLPVYTPGQRLYPQGAFVASYSDPVTALIAIGRQTTARSGNPQTPRILGQQPVSLPQYGNGQAAFIHAAFDSIVNGQRQTSHLLALVITFRTSMPGRWYYYYSQVLAPEPVFARALPTMLQIWRSWKISDKVLIDRMNSAIQSMREIRDIALNVAESRDRAMERAHYDWVEYIRGTRTEHDTKTGEQRDQPLYDITRIIEEKNRREAYERYEEVPLRELIMGRAGARP
jgi:hypothetical protein